MFQGGVAEPAFGYVKKSSAACDPGRGKPPGAGLHRGQADHGPAPRRNGGHPPGPGDLRFLSVQHPADDTGTDIITTGFDVAHADQHPQAGHLGTMTVHDPHAGGPDGGWTPRPSSWTTQIRVIIFTSSEVLGYVNDEYGSWPSPTQHLVGDGES